MILKMMMQRLKHKRLLTKRLLQTDIFRMDFELIESEIDYINNNLDKWRRNLEELNSDSQSNLYDEFVSKVRRLS